MFFSKTFDLPKRPIGDMHQGHNVELEVFGSLCISSLAKYFEPSASDT